MAESVAAWRLQFDVGVYAAVGEMEMIHLLQAEELQLFAIPQTPFYCSEVLVWENRIIPVLDVLSWLEEYRVPRTYPIIGIFRYRTGESTEIEYGALAMESIPERISVNDDQASELPRIPRGWRQLALSCIQHEEQLIPILDLPQLFSGALRAAR